MVKKHSAEGSKVTESKFLTDSKGNQREVDICIESNIGGIPVTISIECTNRSDPATVEWVEQMKGKHDRLPTDILILYSGSGFTEGAKEAAKDFRKCIKRIVPLETLDDSSAERLFGGTGLLSFITTSKTVTKVLIGVAASGDLPAEQVDAFTDTGIFNQSGEAILTAAILVNQILRSPRVSCEFLRTAKDHHKTFNFHTNSVTEGLGIPIYLLKTDQVPPLLRLIESLTVSGTATVQTTPFPLKHGKLEETIVAWGSAPYQGKQALMVASQDKTGETKASFAYGDVSVPLQRPPDSKT